MANQQARRHNNNKIMALRDQPYIPLYVKDFTSDEKLRMCSPSAVGVYIFLMCILHREREYGKLQLRQSFVYTKGDTNAIQSPIQKTQSKENLYLQFAENLAKQMPFKADSILLALLELDYYGVIQLEGNTLYQPRMVRDAERSETRRNSVKQRWSSKAEPESFVSTKRNTKKCTKVDTNTHTNAENEYEYENNIIDSEERDAGEETPAPRKGKAKTFTPPTVEEVDAYCRERENGIDAQEFVDFYTANGWVQGKQGKPLKDWKACVRTWERNGIAPRNNYGTGTAATGGNATGRPSTVQGDTTEPRTRRSTI